MTLELLHGVRDYTLTRTSIPTMTSVVSTLADAQLGDVDELRFIRIDRFR